MIFLTGDIHASWDNRETFIRNLPSSYYLITLGDWGWCWSPLHFKHYLENNPRCIQLWLDGNHENFTYLNTFPVVDAFGGKCHRLADNIYHLMRGEMYEIEDKKFFVFGGALSIDKQWRTPGLSWWPEEIPSKKEFNHALNTLEKHSWTFDYLLTHTCTDDQAEKMFTIQYRIKDKTSDMIQKLKFEITNHNGSYNHHYFGHWHAFAQTDNSTALYREILNLDTGELIF